MLRGWRVRPPLSPFQQHLAERLAQRRPSTVDLPDASLAGVAVLTVPNPDAVLLIRRADRQGDPWSGHMGLPGGRLDAGDRDLLATAIRETQEEVGVTLDPDSLLGVLDDVTPRTPLPRPVVVRPFIFALPERPRLNPNVEVSFTLWVSLEELRSSGVYREALLRIRGEDRSFPAYHLGPHVVWGLTERILTPLLEVLGPKVG